MTSPRSAAPPNAPLDLIALTADDAGEAAGGDVRLFAGAANAVKVAGLIRNVAAAQVALYARTGQQPPWIGYLARDPASNMLVGTCSFVGPPQGGEVEIAYFTFPGAEGRGWGGAMAAALVLMAFAEDGLDRVIAHTLPQEGPSTRILHGLGFTRAGEAVDDEAGIVWKWERVR
jgi:RimJ/RimL family protein N-acetyltransferase